jgi:hypothetical protein
MFSPVSPVCWIPERSFTVLEKEENENQGGLIEETEWDWGYGGSTKNILQEAEFLFDNMPNMEAVSVGEDDEEEHQQEVDGENEEEEEPEEDENLLQLPIHDPLIRLKELEIRTNQTGVQEESHSIQSVSSNSV